MTLPTEQLLPWYEVYPALSILLFMIVVWSAVLTWASASDGDVWWVRVKQYVAQCVSDLRVNSE